MLTPFSHYLQSNQAPSEDETREIKALRANPLEEISIIDVEIEILKRKRARIQESIDDFNTILAPIRRLSGDVLGVIFSHCLATHRNPAMSASEAPILLTQICRDWRSIALSIPRLWSRLHIPTCVLHPQLEDLSRFLEGQRRLEARTEKVQRWLRLSAACPLAIAMPARDLASHPPLLDALIQSSRRWQKFELGFISELDVLTELFSLSPNDLCMLRDLQICTLFPTVRVNLRTNEEREDLWYQSGLLTAQGLRSISIGAMNSNAFPAGIPPNWKNLNHLFIHSQISLGLAHLMLSCCCNLVACLLRIDSQWEPWGSFNTIPDASITLSSCILPHLTFLSLQGDTGQLFRSIEAPALQILDFYQGYFPSEYEEFDLSNLLLDDVYPQYLPSESEEFGLLNFLENINSLETLSVNHHHLTESSVLLKCFALIPSVTHLVLGRSGHPSYPGLDTIITALHEIVCQYSPDSAPTVFLPSLEIFEAYNISDMTDIMLLEFIKARIDATDCNADVSELKKVLVEFSRTRQTDIVPEALDYAQESGIKLKLDLRYITEKDLDARSFRGPIIVEE